MIFYIDKYFSLEIICDIKNAVNFKQNIKYQALYGIMYKRYYDLIKKFFFSLKYTGIKATY